LGNRYSPNIQWKNPVMFVVWVGTLLTGLYTVARLFGYTSQVSLGYLCALDVWLFLTLIFANFASALAEARGKAQADTLRKTRQETPALRLRGYEANKPHLRDGGRPDRNALEQSTSSDLKAGDVVYVEAGQVIPVTQTSVVVD
jgi:K+-transporting ATPase ATPase B chain